jgi:hypothetical protein
MRLWIRVKGAVSAEDNDVLAPDEGRRASRRWSRSCASVDRETSAGSDRHDT